VRTILVVLLALAAAGCLSAPEEARDADATPGVEIAPPLEGSTDAPAPSETAFETRILDGAYEHDRLDAATGAAISWVNAGTTTHSLEFEDARLPDSGPLAPGARATVTFDAPGDFAYHCAFHEGMRGLVVVR